MEEDIITDLTVLQNCLDKIINQVEQRDLALQQFQAFQTTLFTLNSLPEMIDSALAQAKLFFNLEMVGLALLNQDGKISSYLDQSRYNYQQNQSLLLLDDKSKLLPELTQAVFIGAYQAETHQLFFPQLSQSPSHVLIIPLTRHGEYLGSLNLACQAAGQMPAEIRIAFVAQIGFSISICLENHLNFALAQQAYRNEVLATANNRRFLEQRLVEELVRGQRVTLSLSCLMLDVDFPALPNHHDTARLETQVLQTVAETVKRQLRVSDVFSYYEGKKFAAFLANVPEPILLTVTERLKTAIAEQVIQFEKQIIPLSVALGYASYQLRSQSDEVNIQQQIAVQLLAAADASLYDAKHNQSVQPKKITAAQQKSAAVKH